MKKIMICLLLILTELVLAADPAPYGDPMVYYRIGGGRPIHFSPSDPLSTMKLRFGVGVTGMSSMCGNFDPRLTIENGMNAVKKGVEDALVQLEAAATEAIAALPGLMIMKADPRLYEILKNTMFRYQDKFHMSTKTCESMLNTAENGGNPFDKWVKASAVDRWKAAAGTGGLDVNKVKKAIAEDPGRDGITWFNGEIAGCEENCPPIEPIKDTATAGAKMLAGKELDFPNDQSFGEHQPVTKVFETPNDIREWVDKVLGDTKLGTCEGCEKGSKPGKGLTAYIEEEAEVIQEKLLDILNNYSDTGDGPNRKNLAAISAPNFMVTHVVLDAIRNAPPMQRGLFIERLAVEVAQLRAIEKTLVVRRMLLAGNTEPNALNAEASKHYIQETLSQIKTELDQLIYEKEVKKQFVGNTVETILSLQRQGQLASEQDVGHLDPDPHRVIKSRVSSNTEVEVEE